MFDRDEEVRRTFLSGLERELDAAPGSDKEPPYPGSALDAAADRGELVRVSSKKDSGKIRPELVDPGFILGVAEVMTFGAQKYSPGGWMGGMDYSRLYGAALRHLMAWWSGQDQDPESGVSHLYHAACSLMFLAAHERQAPSDTGSKWDDRGRLTPEDPDIRTTMKDTEEG